MEPIALKLVTALVLGFLISVVLGKLLIPLLRRLKAGQSIKEDGPTWHMAKQGTPTMGGLMFIGATLVTVLILDWRGIFLQGDRTCLFVFLFAFVYALIGFLDDYAKVKKKENTGLTAPQKFLLQLAVAIVFLVLLRHEGVLTPNVYVPYVGVEWKLSWVVYMIFAALVITGTVNAVNITDGVDGLAAGTCVPVFLCFTAIVFCWGKEYMPQGIFASGMVGALLGFLIYNFNPARVFMGDTGSLFLGGCISGLAFALDVPLLLIPLCIMPIIETLSDIIQVAYFKLSHGKRVFKMAPFHHHLEMGGWTGRKWKEKEIFVLFAGITLVMAVVSLLGVTGRYSF